MILLNRYQSKIKTPDELLRELGPKPRMAPVVLCHGVFDIVHPGHVHHLLYAKSKADILVVAITSDRFVTKGVHRPHVPQELRALNLSAFEFVDYVLIDDHDGPQELLSKLQPEFYAKGFDYSPDTRGRPVKHTSIVEEYGGQVIYTPGDIAYSSSAILKASPPDLRYEKLGLLMERGNISFDKLRYVVHDIANSEPSVTVVGDLIVDSVTRCSMIGGQTKTPTISARYESRTDYVGGAGIVSMHMAAAGANVRFCTVAGKDDLCKWAIGELQAAKVNPIVGMDSTRPTVNKNAIVVNGYRLLKVDTLDNRTISDEALNLLVLQVAQSKDITVFSDFRHGIFNKRTIPELVKAIPYTSFSVADSQVASRWGNITEFVGFDLVTPNEREARFSLGDQDSGVRPLASALYDALECGTLMLKLGDKGLLSCVDADHDASDSFFTIDSFANVVVDPVGAGDALLAYAALAEWSSEDPIIASILGVFAAAIECEQDGNIPVKPEYVHDRINQVEEAMR